jgi:hypothetical protein
MHNFLVIAAFLVTVLLPCVVTMGAVDPEEGEEA